VAWPNKAGILAEYAQLTCDVRHADRAVADRMWAEVKAAMPDCARRANVEMRIAGEWQFGSERFDPGCIRLIREAAQALDLGEDLDGLPLGLAQAAAVMSVRRLSCREYRGRFGERCEHMSALRIAGVSPAVLATWSLAAECAHELPPAGVAWPALALAAMLDPHGIPGALLTSPAGCGYVTGRPSTAEAALLAATVGRVARQAPAEAAEVPGEGARAVRTMTSS